MPNNRPVPPIRSNNLMDLAPVMWVSPSLEAIAPSVPEALCGVLRVAAASTSAVRTQSTQLKLASVSATQALE